MKREASIAVLNELSKLFLRARKWDEHRAELSKLEEEHWIHPRGMPPDWEDSDDEAFAIVGEMAFLERQMTDHDPCPDCGRHADEHDRRAPSDEQCPT